jgi:hypothetical protein
MYSIPQDSGYCQRHAYGNPYVSSVENRLIWGEVQGAVVARVTCARLPTYESTFGIDLIINIPVFSAVSFILGGGSYS